MGKTTPPFYFNDVLTDTGHTLFYGSPSSGMSVDMGNTMIIGLSGTGKTIRVFTCKADTTDITRLPSQSISLLANAIKENCQVKIKFKS
jgi:hypothetical protein